VPDRRAPQGSDQGHSGFRDADGTSIRTAEGRLFLVVVIDVFTRRIVGWSAASTMDGELTTNTIGLAGCTVRRAPKSRRLSRFSAVSLLAD
jgi:transposase InsO family protein